MPTNVIDRYAGLKVNDAAVLAPKATTGQDDVSKKDYLELKVNNTALNATDRVIELNAQNDDAASTATNVHTKIAGKGKSLMFLGSFANVAALPTAGAEYGGALAMVLVSGTGATALYKLYICTYNGSSAMVWAVVGSQS